jgi:hypothetical protein
MTYQGTQVRSNRVASKAPPLWGNIASSNLASSICAILTQLDSTHLALPQIASPRLASTQLDSTRLVLTKLVRQQCTSETPVMKLECPPPPSSPTHPLRTNNLHAWLTLGTQDDIERRFIMSTGTYRKLRRRVLMESLTTKTSQRYYGP